MEVSEPEFASLGFERGTMVLVDQAAQKGLLDSYQKHEPKLVSGGSVANSIIAFSQLGGQAAFIGCVGDDRYGLFYANEFEELGIDIGNPIIVNETTGTSVCIVTPDAERTMRTCLAVASHLSARHVDEERIKNSDWLFIEGYVFANPETGQTAIQEAMRLARKHGTKIAITCSDAFIAQVFGDAARAPRCSTPTCSSATRPKRAPSPEPSTAEDAFDKLKTTVPSAVVTNGPHGAYVRHARRRGARAGVSERAEGSDRGRRHVRGRVSLRHHARRPAGTGRPRRRLPGAQGDHAGRRPAASRDEAVLGRMPGDD